MAPNVRSAPSASVRILRFDRVQRVAHWANAVLFGILMATAVPLYFGSFFGLVLPRHTVSEFHLWAGIALPLPIIASLVGPWGARMRRERATCQSLDQGRNLLAEEVG